MTDVRQEQHVAGAVRRGQRRAHPRQVGPFAGGLGHCLVDPLIETPRPVDHVVSRVGVDSELPLAEVQHEMRERRDGKPAGRRAGLSQAIGDDHSVAGFLEPDGHLTVRQVGGERPLIAAELDDQEMIVILWTAAGMRSRCDLDTDRRRQRGKRLVRRLRREEVRFFRLGRW